VIPFQRSRLATGNFCAPGSVIAAGVSELDSLAVNDMLYPRRFYMQWYAG
jgi:hypothetical protein